MTDLQEHFQLILWLVAALATSLMACLGVIARQFIREMKTDRDQRNATMAEFKEKIDKIEGYLQGITEELFERMRKAESSLGKLWAEHRVIKEIGSCHLMQNHNREDEEHGVHDE